jgi:hypothetical protein
MARAATPAFWKVAMNRAPARWFTLAVPLPILVRASLRLLLLIAASVVPWAVTGTDAIAPATGVGGKRVVGGTGM